MSKPVFPKTVVKATITKTDVRKLFEALNIGRSITGQLAGLHLEDMSAIPKRERDHYLRLHLVFSEAERLLWASIFKSNRPAIKKWEQEMKKRHMKARAKK